MKQPSYYFNVYYEEVRKLIIDGAAEIVRYYDVDGVHMDDYFYPGNDSAMDNQELKTEKWMSIPFFPKGIAFIARNGLFITILKT